MRTLTTRGRTADQISHRLLCDILRETVQAGYGAVEEDGSVRYRASAVLYLLLLDHPIDRRGRCRSCRRPGAMIGLRRRPCRIHLRTSYWLLHHPDALPLPQLANELSTATLPLTGAVPDLAAAWPASPSRCPRSTDPWIAGWPPVERAAPDAQLPAVSRSPTSPG